MTATPKTKKPSTIATLFAARGWLLAALFLVVLIARIVSDAPLRPEWLIYVVAAAALRLWAGAHLGDHGNEAEAQAPRIARTGPYRLSRNPLYVSNILAAAGLILYANAAALLFELALIALVIIHHTVLILHEEKMLAALHGEDYRRYLASTPRWYGLMRPRDRDAQEDGISKGRVTVSALLRRQGRNVGYMAFCVLLVWAASLAGQ